MHTTEIKVIVRIQVRQQYRRHAEKRKREKKHTHTRKQQKPIEYTMFHLKLVFKT